jgi:hypothetical protein
MELIKYLITIICAFLISLPVKSQYIFYDDKIPEYKLSKSIIYNVKTFPKSYIDNYDNLFVYKKYFGKSSDLQICFSIKKMEHVVCNKDQIEVFPVRRN